MREEIIKMSIAKIKSGLSIFQEENFLVLFLLRHIMI